MTGSTAPHKSILLLLAAALLLGVTGCDPDPPTNDAQCIGAGCGDAVAESCSSTDDCEPGYTCQDGFCRPPDGCKSDDDCPSGQECVQGGCYPESSDTGPSDAGDVDPVDGVAGDAGDADDGTADGVVDACSGCILNADTGRRCVPGTRSEACGSGGDACTVCDDDEVCKMGSCKPKPCDASTCPNGCCQNGTCKSGMADDACGTGGEACDSCTGQTSCQNQTCQVVCNSQTCGGCCSSSGKCKKGTTDGACGSGGSICQSCGSDEKCANGKCVQLSCSQRCSSGCCDGSTCKPGTSDSACGDNGDFCKSCGWGFECDFQRCDLDNNSKWKLVGVSAKVPKTDESGVFWDSRGNKPDVRLKVKNTGFSTTHKGKTEVDKNDLTPFWYDDTITNVEARDMRRYNKTKFTLIDKDPWVNPNDQIASCKIDIDEKHFDGQTYSVTCKGAGSGSNQVKTTVRYQIQAP